MPAAIEHRVIAQADSGFVPITLSCDLGQNPHLYDISTLGACAPNHVATSDFAADDHASARSDKAATGPLFERSLGPIARRTVYRSAAERRYREGMDHAHEPDRSHRAIPDT